MAQTVNNGSTCTVDKIGAVNGRVMGGLYIKDSAIVADMERMKPIPPPPPLPQVDVLGQHRGVS